MHERFHAFLPVRIHPDRHEAQTYRESRGSFMLDSRSTGCWNDIVGCKKQHTQKNLIYIHYHPVRFLQVRLFYTRIVSRDVGRGFSLAFMHKSKPKGLPYVLHAKT